MKKICIYAWMVCVLCACNVNIFEEDKVPIAQVGVNVLYFEDIEGMLDEDIFDGDSVQFIESYIEKWTIGQLLYELALNNISHSDDLEKLVEEYKKALYIYTYQQQFVEQELDMPNDESARRYYDANQSLFVQDELLMKGLFLSFQKSMKDGNKIKQVLRRFKVSDTQKVESFSLENADTYDYFMDDWVEVGQLVDKLPVGANIVDISAKKSYYEYSDSSMYYILYVDSIVERGEVAPYDYVKDYSKALLYKQMKMDYIKNLGPQIYQDAIHSNKAVVYRDTIASLMLR